MPPPAPVVHGEKRHGYIDSLIYWRDPKTSAGVLAAGLGFFALTIVFRYSYTALACMFFLVHLLVSVSACAACLVPFRSAAPAACGRDARFAVGRHSCRYGIQLSSWAGSESLRSWSRSFLSLL